MYRHCPIKVLIPALNEQGALGKVLAAIPRWVDEVVVVDNGSTDATAEVAAAGGARVVSEPRRGYGQACLTGMVNLGPCDVVVFLDADFSDYPQQMDRLVEPVASGQAHMVIGSRVLGPRQAGALTLPQRLGNALACRLMQLFWRRRHTDLGPFRAIRTSALLGLEMTDTGYGWTIEMQIKATRAGLAVVETPVDYRCRIGKSKISGTVRGVVGAGTKILWTIFRYALRPPPPAAARPDRLIVFGRYPRVGRAKTRLIGALGAVGAAECQRRMTRRLLATVGGPGGLVDVAVEVRYADADAAKMRRWLGGGIRYAPQGRGDLGRRMARALADALAAGCRRVVLIGTDVPSITGRLLRRAFDGLNDYDVVLGPSEDGGYYLVALRRPAGIFDGVTWSAPTVLQETLSRARSQGLSVLLVDRLNDVDEPDDLAGLPAGMRPVDPYVSVIVPALNESACVASAVRSATSEGAEVILVDGGSTDDTAARAEAAGARVLICPAGRAGQMNRGAGEACGQVLLFLHADTVLPVGYVSDVFEAMADPQTVGGAFGHATDLDRRSMKLVQRLVHFRARYLRLPYGDQGLFVRRSVFERIGGFPATPIAEDFHFVRSLRRRGRIAILPSQAITSGRRWHAMGVLRTTLINQFIVVGCLLGVSDRLLKNLYEKTRQAPPG